MKRTIAWTPAVLMGIGALFTVGIDTQRSMPLAQPLSTAVSHRIAGYAGQDVEMSVGELRVAAPSSHLLRTYAPPDSPADSADWFSVYVGYYERQMRGTTIHSPKNCLPGAGWEALTSEPVTISTTEGDVVANRYVLQRQSEQVLVLYWYQGRGRVASNEYAVKLDLLRDAAIRRRSEEALVRVVVPVVADQETAFSLASSVAATLVPQVETALPAW